MLTTAPRAGRGGADSLVTLRTSSTGAIGFDASLNKSAGIFGVVVSVDGIARRDTVQFTVLPGQPASMRVVTRDTLATFDVPYRPAVIVADRFGNRWTDQPTLTTISGNCRVSDVTVIASDVSRCEVGARLGAFGDSFILTMVAIHRPPKARIVAVTRTRGSACNYPMFEHCRVWQTQLDGSQPRILMPSVSNFGQRSNWVDVTADGKTLVYAAAGSRLHTLDLPTGRDVDLGSTLISLMSTHRGFVWRQRDMSAAFSVRSSSRVSTERVRGRSRPAPGSTTLCSGSPGDSGFSRPS